MAATPASTSPTPPSPPRTIPSHAIQALTAQFPSLVAQSSHRHVRCIVKLGGAAITRKEELETVNEPVLAATKLHLKEAMGLPFATVSMDWSRKEEGGVIADLVPNCSGQNLEFPNAFIIVHGAEGIPAVGLPPFAAGWSTQNKALKRDNVLEVRRAVDAGFVPVLHGDAVLDNTLGCTILSGDVIVRRLAQVVKPSFVVFLTNVPGVFDRSPEEPNATLLREIVVFEDSSWTIVDPPFGVNSKNGVQTTVAAHDTTGGMSTKIAEAASIAAMGIDVYIVEAGTPHALEALRGHVKNLKSKKTWMGTLIRSALGRSS